MKKRFLLGLLIVLVSSACFAQVKLSLQGGTSLTGITGGTDYNACMGYRLGIGIGFPVNKVWSVQTGLQVLNRRYSFEQTKLYEVATAEGAQGYITAYAKSQINAVYLQLPVKVAAFVPINKNCGFQFSAGPYLSYGIGGHSTLEMAYAAMESGYEDGKIHPAGGSSSGITGSKHATFDSRDGLKRMDVGLSVGVDFKYRFLFAGFGAEYGFVPIDKKFPKDINSSVLGIEQKLVSPHNIGLEIHIGFCFL